MDFLDNEYKNRFRNKQLSDDKVDADDLWAAIESDLEKPNNQPNGFWHWVNKHRFSIIATISLGLLIGFQATQTTPSVSRTKISDNQNFENQNNNFITQTTPSVGRTKISDIQNFENQNNNFATQTTPSVGRAKISDIQNFENQNNNFTTQQNSQQTQNAPATISDKTLNLAVLHSTKNSLSENKPTFINDERSVAIAKEVTTNFDKATKNSQNKIVIQENNNLIATQNQGSLQSETLLASLDLLPLRKAHVSAAIQPIQPIGKVNFATPIKPLKSKMIWEVGFNFGVNTLKMNYLNSSDAAIANQKSETEKLEIGWNMGLDVTTLFHKNWRLSSGLSYQQSYVKFDYKQEKPLQILKENQLLQVWINSLTGETVQRRYGDTTINALSLREVVHYNSFQQLSIPILLGFQKSFAKWTYGIDMGTNLNFTFNQSGRLLDDVGEIQFFSNADAIAPFRKFNVGFQVNPFIRYQITSKCAIALQPQWAWQQNSNIGTTGMSLQVHQFGLNMRSIFKF